jgi:hypothetical protein
MRTRTKQELKELVALLNDAVESEAYETASFYALNLRMHLQDKFEEIKDKEKE